MWNASTSWPVPLHSNTRVRASLTLVAGRIVDNTAPEASVGLQVMSFLDYSVPFDRCERHSQQEMTKWHTKKVSHFA